MNVEFYADIDKDISDEIIQNIISYMRNTLHSTIRCFIDGRDMPAINRVVRAFTGYPFSTAEDEEEIPF